ncbi:putative membrane protein [Nitrospina gracilis]|nr:lysylphosphatidylglycerol synthase transmembrane domain-containing protein [Nitrospina sp. Nb-3]MCF8724617.1 putative membrane protein [Nitrospina sp. Nb-3]
MSKILKPLFFLFGVGLFAWAVSTVDFKDVTHHLLDMGWGFLLIFLAYGLVAYFDARSWQFAFKPEEVKRLTTFALWKVRTIGESFNAITPFGSLGGEPVKAHFLKEQYGLGYKQGLASQVVARTTLMLSLLLFMIPGTVFLFLTDGIDETFKNGSAAGLITFSVLIILFLLFQTTGCLSILVGWFDRTFPKSEARPAVDHLLQLCNMMSGYYREHHTLCFKSIWYGWLGWVAGVIELYFTLYFLGVELSWMELWTIEAILQLVRVGSFFIPVSLGAQEAGLVVIFMSMGMSGPLGLAVSLVRRIRELIWIGLGLLLGGSAAFKPMRIPAESSEQP